MCIIQEPNYDENSKKVKDIPMNDYVREDAKSFFLMKKWLQNPVQCSSFFKNLFVRKNSNRYDFGRWRNEELNEMATELVKCKDSSDAKAYKQRIVFQIFKLIILHSITYKCSVSQNIVKELEQANSEECKETQSSEIKMLHDIVTRYHERNADDDMGELSNECEQLCITQTCEISNKEDGCISLVGPNDGSQKKQFRAYFFNPDITQPKPGMAIVICFGTHKGI
ncbi:hypothetical protein RFI_34620 [Reticulomyxa filosa]|uniref:Uncharacterized protein n=1 Tax=Reticulomyxa filosa TaxID=46433 RepID=X6LMF6_RETFI|nr:hypothetical protein RFI_34620 [Reticulomyxa filosa]|eukprot:ETO02794.1 hypothetical protein RFI_34620 [Reticulomyxa filosa]